MACERRTTHGEIAELHEGFRLLAGNRVVQSISVNELKATFDSVGYHPSEEEVRDFISVTNQQARDSLTFTEFLLLMTKEADDAMVEEMKSAFRACDKNHTGYISTMQFIEMFATMGEKSSPNEVQELLALADPDASGRVDYQAFVDKLVAKVL
jgi:calmodulin